MAKAKDAGIDVRRVEPTEIRPEFVRALMNIGYRSWLADLPRRTPLEVGRIFDSSNPDIFNRQARNFLEIAREGALIVASSVSLEQPVGYTMAVDDVSGTRAEQIIKHVFVPSKVYARVADLSVIREFRGQGVELQLLRAAMDTFRPRQKPTTYILKEDPTSAELFGQVGFQLAPSDQIPKITTDYFGDDRPPAHQYRYEAPSVAEVSQRIESIVAG